MRNRKLILGKKATDQQVFKDRVSSAYGYASRAMYALRSTASYSIGQMRTWLTTRIMD